jgi:ketosteroid isomerase-like protein
MRHIPALLKTNFMKSASNQRQIRQLVNNWTKAVRAKDMDGALAHHAKDMVMFDVPPPLQSKGINAYKKTWELFFDTNREAKASFELRELKITAGDTVAFCHALLIAGSAKRPQGRLTIGLKKVRGDWLITHEHHSYPIGES